MASSPFALYFDVESSSSSGESAQLPPVPIAPERALPRTYHSVPQAPPDPIELDNLQWGAKLTGPVDTEAGNPLGGEGPSVPSDLEMSRPTTPVQDGEVFGAMQSFKDPPMNKFRMIAFCVMIFLSGLNDSAPGALIPYIESHYGIGYAMVSLIFVTNAAGFVSAAFVVEALRARIGQSWTLILSNSFLVCGYIPIICLAYAINLALGNVFIGNLQNSTQMLGVAHAFYGLGGTIGPLVATAIVTSGGLVWSRFYFLTLSLALFNAAFAGWSFWDYEQESSIPLRATRSNHSRRGNAERLESADVAPLASQPPLKLISQFSSMAKSFRSRVVLLGALFIFAYQGAEVSISGWVISFLLTTRHGDPSSVGYVTAGFWAGIMLGRVFLSHPAHKIGEKIFVYGIVLGAAAFQMLVWWVPNVFGDAIAVAIVGLLLGPVYPCAAAVFTRTIPRSSQISGLGMISAFGSSGGAVAPFTTGILAQAVGTFVLHPIAIGLFAVMLGSWYGIPNVRKRRE